MSEGAKTYRVNEVFYSVQGEGYLAGAPMVFVRFSKCNMKCDTEPGPLSPGFFQCDTEFESGERHTLEELELLVELEHQGTFKALGDERAAQRWHDSLDRWLLLTGGEPGLQVDEAFCKYFHSKGWNLAIETNGSLELPSQTAPTWTLEEAERHWRGERGEGWLAPFLAETFPSFDHITVSPKVAEHAIRQRWAHEVRYVRGAGQAIPETRVQALHRYLSPAFLGDQPDPRAVRTCLDLVLRHPGWRLSVQAHKTWLQGGVVR